MILKSADADKEIALVKAVEADDTGQISFAYLRLTDEDFERLTYALAKSSAPINTVRTWDDATPFNL